MPFLLLFFVERTGPYYSHKGQANTWANFQVSARCHSCFVAHQNNQIIGQSSVQRYILHQPPPTRDCHLDGTRCVSPLDSRTSPLSDTGREGGEREGGGGCQVRRKLEYQLPLTSTVHCLRVQSCDEISHEASILVGYFMPPFATGRARVLVS